MKKILNLFGILLLSLFIYGLYILAQNNKEKSIKRKINQKEYADSLTIFNAFIDSIGTLSFYDITLGTSFSTTVRKIKNNKNIKNIEIYNKYHCSANITISHPDDKRPIPIELIINSFQDSIYRICAISYNYTDRNILKDLYCEKYKLKYSTKKEEELGIEKRETLEWNLENQSILMCTNYLLRKSTYTRELYNEQRLWGKYNIRDNIYFDNFKIEYINTPLKIKADRQNEEEYERKQKIYRQKMLEQQKKDSIEKVQRKAEFIRNI